MKKIKKIILILILSVITCTIGTNIKSCKNDNIEKTTYKRKANNNNNNRLNNNIYWMLPSYSEIQDYIQNDLGVNGYTIGMITYDLLKGKIYTIDIQDFDTLSNYGENPQLAIPIDENFNGFSNYDYIIDFWTPYNLTKEDNIFNFISSYNNLEFNRMDIEIDFTCRLSGRKIWYISGFSHDHLEDWSVRSVAKNSVARNGYKLDFSISSSDLENYDNLSYYISMPCTSSYTENDLILQVNQNVSTSNNDIYNKDTQEIYFIENNKYYIELDRLYKQQLANYQGLFEDNIRLNNNILDLEQEIGGLEEEKYLLELEIEELEEKLANSGYTQGFKDGQKDAFNILNFMRSILKTVDSVLSIEILPYIKLWYIVGIPIILSIVDFILKRFR